MSLSYPDGRDRCLPKALSKEGESGKGDHLSGGLGFDDPEQQAASPWGILGCAHGTPSLGSLPCRGHRFLGALRLLKELRGSLRGHPSLGTGCCSFQGPWARTAAT